MRIQNDIRDTDGPLPSGEGTFRIPLKRPGVRGSIGRSIDFQVDRELVRDDGWRDVFVNLRWRPALNVRAGQFKLPFSLEETSPTTALDFMYRARAARQLAPGRDPGAMAYGALANGVVRYEAGIFTKDGRNSRRPDSDRVQGKGTLAARLRVMPFSRSSGALRSLDLGAAGITSQLPEGLPALRGRTALDATFFSSDRIVGGRRRRVGLELAWQPGPFAVKSEYIRVTDERPAASGIDGRLEATAWYASAMWVITGEAKGAGLDLACSTGTSRRTGHRRGWRPCGVAAVSRRLTHRVGHSHRHRRRELESQPLGAGAVQSDSRASRSPGVTVAVLASRIQNSVHHLTGTTRTTGTTGTGTRLRRAIIIWLGARA